MKTAFEVNTVLPKLTQVASVINSKNNIAILSDVYVTVNNNNIIVTGSDGETWITQRTDIVSTEEGGVFCVSASDILKSLGSLKDETVTMTLDEEKKLVVLDYGKGSISLPYESAEEYPSPMMNMDEASEMILPSQLLLSAIETTQTAIANDELRPIMNGIHFDFVGNSMTCNTCNFLKMVKYRKHLEGMDVEHCYFTLPKKPSALLTSILSDVEENVKLRFTDKSVSVSNKDFKITARLLEGNYPDCDRIIPKDTVMSVEVESDVMLQALRHVLSVDNSSNLVVLEFNGDDITISAEDFNNNKAAKEAFKCKNDTNSEFSICFNGVVLMEMLKNIDDDNVVFEMSNPTKPAILYSKENISKDEYLSLIMPMVQNNKLQQPQPQQ